MSVSLKGSCQENGAKFSVVPKNKTRSNGQKLMHIKFHLNMTKNFFTVWVTVLGQVAQGGCEESPSQELFRKCLDAILCSVH